MYTAFNGLDILAVDIQNTYLQVLCLEKVWIKCRKEVGPELQGRLVIVVRVLYEKNQVVGIFKITCKTVWSIWDINLTGDIYIYGLGKMWRS